MLDPQFSMRLIIGALISFFLNAYYTIAAEDKPPNIVFIMADDLGFGDLGVTGQLARASEGLPAIQTPNIDALAGQSLRFNNMYSTPVCASTRAMLLTGFHQGHALVDSVRAVDNPDIRAGNEDKTWGQVLQQAGYKTSMYGKWHLGGVNGFSTVSNPAITPVQKGFEEVYGSLIGAYRQPFLWESDGMGSLQLSPVPEDPTWQGPGLPYQYSEDATANRIEQFIRTNSNGTQPFSVYAAFNAPHTPLDNFTTAPYTDETWPEGQKSYAAMITRLDQHVGQIVSALEDPNDDGDLSDSVMDDTLLVFTSDNGAHWRQGSIDFDPEFFNSNAGYAESKASTREGGIRVPFFVRWDGVTQPGDNNEQVGTLADIMPTFAELVGEDAPIGIDGVSMLAPIKGEGPGERPDIDSWFRHQNFSIFDYHGWAVRIGDWKMVNLESSSPQLYNLADDPFEQNDLAASRVDMVSVLTAIGVAEGYGREPIIPRPDFPTVDWTLNTLFTQYKQWAPAAGSIDFGDAANWTGGTQKGISGDPDALNWNTGPADNWLATVANTTGGSLHSVVSANTEVLAVEIRADLGRMYVVVAPGVKLSARNGLRIGNGGNLVLNDGEINTIRRIEIQVGGALTGEGDIKGQQHLLAGIPEFQGQGLLEPEVVNAGQVAIDGLALAGKLTVDGTYQQTHTGTLSLDLFSDGDAPGVDFDQLSVTGNASLAGFLDVDLLNGLQPARGDTFEVITSANLIDNGLILSGTNAGNFIFSIVSNANLVLEYINADFDADGDIDGSDFLALQSGFGLSSGATLSQGDANGDGSVDQGDLFAWQHAFGVVSGAQMVNLVPEPVTLVVLIVTAAPFFLATRRRHRHL